MLISIKKTKTIIKNKKIQRMDGWKFSRNYVFIYILGNHNDPAAAVFQGQDRRNKISSHARSQPYYG